MATTGGGGRQGRDSGASEGIGGSRRGERSQRECGARPGCVSRGAQWCGGCGERDDSGGRDRRGVARAWAWRGSGPAGAEEERQARAWACIGAGMCHGVNPRSSVATPAMAMADGGSRPRRNT